MVCYPPYGICPFSVALILEMGCGHSKINIYPRKSRSKSNSKKAVTPEKTESEEEEGLENDELENNENLEDCDSKKTIKVKPFGGPLLAQTDISSSQQDFFKMLDDKIQNGPDYNSESEIEKTAEAARLSALLKDWETASAGSRSLPATPKRRSKPTAAAAAALAEKLRPDGVRSADVSRAIITDRNYVTQIPQSVIHQSYGVTQLPYTNTRQIPYCSSTNNPPQSHQIPSYPSALQYQAISPMYTSQPTYQPPPLPRQYPSYNQHGSPIKTYLNSTSSPASPKHIPYDLHHHHQQLQSTFTSSSSPSHKLYGPPVPPVLHHQQQQQQQPIYSNGEFLQQQFFNQQQMQYQQYKEAREQVLAQNQQQHVLHQQQQQQQQPQSVGGYRRNYQSSVTIPIVQNHENEMNNALHRKQYELT